MGKWQRRERDSSSYQAAKEQMARKNNIFPSDGWNNPLSLEIRIIQHFQNSERGNGKSHGAFCPSGSGDKGGKKLGRDGGLTRKSASVKLPSIYRNHL